MSKLRLLSLVVVVLFSACRDAPLEPDVLPEGAVPQSAAAPNTGAVTIEGTGVPAIDFPALQAAMAVGGTIYLKGHFDLGTESLLLVSRDVEILGEGR